MASCLPDATEFTSSNRAAEILGVNRSTACRSWPRPASLAGPIPACDTSDSPGPKSNGSPLSHGCPVQAIVVAFGIHERTVADWRDRAGRHGQRLHEHVVLQGQVELRPVQADELYAKVVGRRLGMARARAVPSRLGLGGVVSTRRDLIPAPVGLFDAEQRVIDDLEGVLDWPPDEARLDENISPEYWGEYADWHIYNPTEAESRWAAETSPFANESYDVVETGCPVDRVRASMIHPVVANALACGLVALD